MEGILGRKVGMTQIYVEDGTAIPVTVIKAGPCLVVQVKTAESDGYEAVQIGLVEDKPAKPNQPMGGHFKKAGVAPVRKVEEFRLDSGEEVKAGDEVKASMFAEKDYVDVVGTSKGKGYQGVMKRHNFRGGRGSHGSMFHRAPGSIGSSAYPSRVFKGMRMAGRMGGDQVTTKNLQIVKVDADLNLIYVRGSVPGPISGYVAIRRAKRG
ncbi:MAG TPA: 50S ribosomal protein L3 [Thermoanaerobaculia bacterium]|jgi:large subunit ribosomal protein L3|nr:50S ribosomal protein L3 [Thermoanaerobaculia bacterium]